MQSRRDAEIVIPSIKPEADLNATVSAKVRFPSSKKWISPVVSIGILVSGLGGGGAFTMSLVNADYADMKKSNTEDHKRYDNDLNSVKKDLQALLDYIKGTHRDAILMRAMRDAHSVTDALPDEIRYKQYDELVKKNVKRLTEYKDSCESITCDE